MKNTSEIPSPCFVLEEIKLLKNLELINQVKEAAGVDIIVAFKGFAMWSTFPQVRRFITGATASSLNEALLCKEEMGTKAHTYCVAYDPGDFDQIVANSSHLTFNSLSQYERFGSQVPEGVSIGLRVNPGWSDVETALYNPASSSSRLGIEHLSDLPDRVEGLHFHVLCESSSASLGRVLESFEKRFGHLLKYVKWVNMGGGHLMTRKGYDTGLLVEVLEKFRKKHEVEIILEPGSAFAWEAGFLTTTVLDVVENGKVKTVIIDASFTCHMPDCLEMPYRPVIEGAYKKEQKGMEAYRIGGVSCLAGDYLDEYWFEKPLQIGDRVVFQDMIHYTMVKTSMFNGINHPKIGILKEDGIVDVVREFGYTDYKRGLS